MTKIRATIEYLRKCQQARAAGYRVSYTTSSWWLVDMAINRRAGWPDDPSLHRGSAMPVNGKYPKKAEGDIFMPMVRLAGLMKNAPRVRIYPSMVPKEYRRRLKTRITWPGEE